MVKDSEKVVKNATVTHNSLLHADCTDMCISSDIRMCQFLL